MTDLIKADEAEEERVAKLALVAAVAAFKKTADFDVEVERQDVAREVVAAFAAVHDVQVLNKDVFLDDEHIVATAFWISLVVVEGEPPANPYSAAGFRIMGLASGFAALHFAGHLCNALEDEEGGLMPTGYDAAWLMKHYRRATDEK